MRPLEVEVKELDYKKRKLDAVTESEKEILKISIKYGVPNSAIIALLGE